MDHGYLFIAQARGPFVLGEPVAEAVHAEAYRRLGVLTKPHGSLGRLEPLGIVIVAEHGVSTYPREFTAQMVANYTHCGAAISVLARGGDAVAQAARRMLVLVDGFTATVAAALALSVVRAVVALFTDMATFENAGVSDRDA